MKKFLALDNYNGLNYDELVKQLASDYALPRANVEKYEILVASYSSESYEGYGYLFLQEKSTGNFFEVHSSHCSCFFLENQFEPEAVELKYILSKHYNANGNEDVIREFLCSELRKSKIENFLSNE
jgi:hypothetical protein